MYSSRCEGLGGVCDHILKHLRYKKIPVHCLQCVYMEMLEGAVMLKMARENT